MRLYLKYPKRIFAREKDGLRWVHKFTKKNLEKSDDIVLQCKEYDLSNIYNANVHFKDIKIESNSVGIIPNSQIIKWGNESKIYSIYHLLISKLINAKKKVYILRHSYEDLEVCEKILNSSPESKNVKLIPDDLNVTEISNIIRQFDFIIASRYHSVVDAYKNGVPALVIGWATKYFELLKTFGQLDYFYDCRNNIDINEINNSLDKMTGNYRCEGEKIIKNVNVLRKRNIFDICFASITS